MLTAEHNSSTLEDPCAPPPNRVTMQEPRASEGSHTAQPHLENRSTYHQPNRIVNLTNRGCGGVEVGRRHLSGCAIDSMEALMPLLGVV